MASTVVSMPTFPLAASRRYELSYDLPSSPKISVMDWDESCAALDLISQEVIRLQEIDVKHPELAKIRALSVAIHNRRIALNIEREAIIRALRG